MKNPVSIAIETGFFICSLNFNYSVLFSAALPWETNLSAAGNIINAKIGIDRILRLLKILQGQVRSVLEITLDADDEDRAALMVKYTLEQ